MITDISDVLEELNLQLKVDHEAMEKVMPSDKAEAGILEILEVEELHIDEIARLSKLTSDKISSKLTIMELKGLVKAIGLGFYKRL